MTWPMPRPSTCSRIGPQRRARPFNEGKQLVNSQTYRWLRRLHHRHGPREFGRICQKFMAIAYRLANFEHVVERGVQGVDVDAARGCHEKYTTEIKTTESRSVTFHQKDVDGLSSRAKDGYTPLLGILRLSPL